MSSTPDGPTGREIARLTGPPGDDILDLPLRTTVANIGQGPRNEIVLDDDSVSTNHARLEYVEGVWRLVDLDSKNGTYLGGVRLAPGVPTPVADGAALAFGGTKLTFRAQAITEADLARAASTPSAARPSSEKRPTGFRLPVWLFLLVILLIAVVVFLVALTGDPGTTESLPEVVTYSRALTVHIPAAA